MITDYTRLINKEYPLPPDYVPPDLIDIGLPFDCAPGNPKRLLEKRTAYAASELICRSQHEGISLCCISGYRSYDRQKELFRGSSYVAAPGTSEHQSGLALDLSSPSVQMEHYRKIWRYFGGTLACLPRTFLWIYPSLSSRKRRHYQVSL